MISAYIAEICKRLNLGLPAGEPERVSGGLLHLMWKLETDKGAYAIKQLSQDIKLTPVVKTAYELTEQIAEQFKQQGIPAISALTENGQHLLVVFGAGFLVYPWVESQMLGKEAISEAHALAIAVLLAKMHQIQVKIPEILESEFVVHSAEKIIRLTQKSSAFQCAFADQLKANQDTISFINNAYKQAIPVLKSDVIISHGDLDPKNVLWDEHNQPLLIDWESARALNPTYDIITVALDWSGITTKHFNPKLFIEMIHTYLAAGGKINPKHVEAAFYGVLGNWLNWMIYNVERACRFDPNETEQRIIGTEQAQQTLQTILRLDAQVAQLIGLVV